MTPSFIGPTASSDEGDFNRQGTRNRMQLFRRTGCALREAGMNYADTAYLYNRRILVVEDEALIAMMVRDVLMDVGCRTMTSFNTLDALELANSERLDGAVLDIRIDDDMVFGVADALARRDIPFVFTTGHCADIVPGRYRGHALLLKPYMPTDVAQSILAELKNHSVHPSERIRVTADAFARRVDGAEVTHANSN